MFFETINAAGVLQVPMIISVWDDEYGISVHAKHQTTKEYYILQTALIQSFIIQENNYATVSQYPGRNITISHVFRVA